MVWVREYAIGYRLVVTMSSYMAEGFMIGYGKAVGCNLHVGYSVVPHSHCALLLHVSTWHRSTQVSSPSTPNAMNWVVHAVCVPFGGVE